MTRKALCLPLFFWRLELCIATIYKENDETAFCQTSFKACQLNPVFCVLRWPVIMKCTKRLSYNGTQADGTSSSFRLRYTPYQRSSTSSASTNDVSAPLTESSAFASAGKKTTSNESVFSFDGDAEQATGQTGYPFLAQGVGTMSGEGAACLQLQGTSSPLPPVQSTPVASSPGVPAASSCLLQCPPLGSDGYHQQFPATAGLSSFHHSQYAPCVPRLTLPPLPDLSGAAAAFPLIGHDGEDSNLQSFASIALATGASNSAADDKKKPARTYERRLEVQATGPSDFRPSAITVELCTRAREFEYWKALAKNNTEMIVTKAGR